MLKRPTCIMHIYIYTGKDSDGIGLEENQKTLSKPTQSVVRLCTPIKNTNRNVTADNWFTSIETLDELEKMKLTYVGTMRKDKRQIPPEFLANPQKPENSAMYGFTKEKTLLSYVPAKNKVCVILVSTMHHCVETNESKKKPEIIAYYNETKCGVDVLDMRCAIFDTRRRTRRWPLVVYFRILSILSANSYILYLCYRGSALINRFTFVQNLGKEFITPHLRKRLRIPNLRRDVKGIILKTLGEEEHNRQVQGIPNDKLEKRKTCSKCPSVKERKTAYKCIKCDRPICLECSRKICVDCAVLP